MLSYQHGYHAGNFSDVIKHLTLSRLLAYLSQKPKPLLYLETHAGRGLYDLRDGQAQKNAEFLEGISLLWEARKKAPELMAPYLHTIAKLNPNNELRYYPGSPWLSLEGLRSQDRLVFIERHPKEFSFLEQLPGSAKRFCYNTDGIKEMTALLPPIERRGLIFIDPSYEIKEEYKTIPKAIEAAHKRFATGVYCLWYPILTAYQHRQILTAFTNNGLTNSLRLVFNLNPLSQEGMSGCGLWLVNPPYVLAEEMRTLFEFVKGVFGKGSYSIDSGPRP